MLVLFLRIFFQKLAIDVLLILMKSCLFLKASCCSFLLNLVVAGEKMAGVYSESQADQSLHVMQGSR